MAEKKYCELIATKNHFEQEAGNALKNGNVLAFQLFKKLVQRTEEEISIFCRGFIYE